MRAKVKRTLKRKLKVLEIAEREENGTSLLAEIVVCPFDVPASTQVWQVLLKRSCMVFLSLLVNPCSYLRKTPGKW